MSPYPRRKQQAEVIATLEGGDCFGEMALLEDQPRSATIRTLEDAEFYTLSKAAFHEAMTRSRSLRDQILELLSQRR